MSHLYTDASSTDWPESNIHGQALSGCPDCHEQSRRVIMGLPTATRRRSEPCASIEPNFFPEGLPARFGGA